MIPIPLLMMKLNFLSLLPKNNKILNSSSNNNQKKVKKIKLPRKWEESLYMTLMLN